MFASSLVLLTLAGAGGEWIDAFLDGQRALDRGDLGAAREQTMRAIEAFPGHAPSAWAMADIAASEGKLDEAFDWLEEAGRRGGGEAALLAWDPQLTALRNDPRFAALLAEWRATTAPEDLLEPQRLSAMGPARPSWRSDEPAVWQDGPNGEWLYDFHAHEILELLSHDASTEAPRNEDPRAQVMKSLSVHLENVNSMCLADDRSVALLLRTLDGISEVVVWNVGGGCALASHATDLVAPLARLGISPDGASGFWYDLRSPRLTIVDMCTGEVIAEHDANVAPWFDAVAVADGVVAADGAGEVNWLRSDGSRERLGLNATATGNVDLKMPIVGRGVLVSKGRWLASFELGEPPVLNWEISGRESLQVLPRGVIDEGRRLRLLVDGRHSLWDARSGREIDRRPEFVERSSLAIDEERRTAFLTTDCGDLRKFDVESGHTEVLLAESPGEFAELFVSPGGSVLVGVQFTGASKRASAFRVAPFEFIGQGLLGPSKIPEACIAFHPNETEVCLGGRVLDAGAQRRRFEFETMQGVCAYRPDGEQLVIVDDARRLRFFDPRTGAEVAKSLGLGSAPDCMTFEPGSDRLWVSLEEARFRVLDTQAMLWSSLPPWDDVFDGTDFETSMIRFAPEGNTAAVGTDLWSHFAAFRTMPATNLWQHTYGGGNRGLVDVGFTSDGTGVLVFGHGTGHVQVRDSDTGDLRHDLGDPEHGRRKLYAHFDPSLVLDKRAHGLDLVEIDTGHVRTRRTEWVNGGWITCADSQHFAGTADAIRFAHLPLARGSLPLDAVAATMLDPKRVRAAAAGVRLRPAKLPKIPTMFFRGGVSRVLRLPPGERSVRLRVRATCVAGLAGLEVREDSVQTIVALDRKLVAESELEFTLPDSGEMQVRLRALSTDGGRSRALHLTLRAGE